jgi:hypothetical protein
VVEEEEDQDYDHIPSKDETSREGNPSTIKEEDSNLGKEENPSPSKEEDPNTTKEENLSPSIEADFKPTEDEEDSSSSKEDHDSNPKEENIHYTTSEDKVMQDKPASDTDSFYGAIQQTDSR